MVVKASNSPLLESKVARRVHGAEYKFGYFDQTELKSVVVIMVEYYFKYHSLYMANMISPKVCLAATEYNR